MQKKVLTFISLLSLSAVSHAGSYVNLSVGTENLTADTFKFHNPAGTQFAQNSTGSYINLDNVDDKDNAISYSLAWGMPIDGTNFRAELSYTTRDEVTFNGTADFGVDVSQELKVESDNLMLFGYYDYAVSNASNVYFGLGAGVAFNSASGLQGANLGGDGYFPKNSSTEFAWGVALGYSTQLSKDLTLDINYGYTNLGQANTGTTDASFGAVGMNADERLESELSSQSLNIGLRVYF